MLGLRKRVFEEFKEDDEESIKAQNEADNWGDAKNKWLNESRDLKRQCRTHVSTIEEKSVELEKAKELVSKLTREVEWEKQHLKSKTNTREMIKGIVSKIDESIVECEKVIMRKTRPLIEEHAEEYGVYYEFEKECNVCMNQWSCVFNSCVSENCKFVMCVKCLVKCKNKCPNCRAEFKK